MYRLQVRHDSALGPTLLARVPELYLRLDAVPGPGPMGRPLERRTLSYSSYFSENRTLFGSESRTSRTSRTLVLDAVGSYVAQ